MGARFTGPSRAGAAPAFSSPAHRDFVTEPPEAPAKGEGTTMKNSARMMRVGVIAAMVVFVQGTISADQPVVVINSPTGTVYSASFPFTVPISFSVTHHEVKNLNVLDVQVNGTSILTGGSAIGNPFSGPSNTNACSAGMVLPNISYCNVADSDHASATAPWAVENPGTYTVAVSVKHQNAEGGDVETVIISQLSAEYPAPPAVANAYINANLKSGSAKVRGCVISKIADNHAKESTYGPKGGPYDETLIESDVLAYWPTCGGV